MALGWWVISGEEFLDALTRAHIGEDPDFVYMEFYANADICQYDKEADMYDIPDEAYEDE